MKKDNEIDTDLKDGFIQPNADVFAQDAGRASKAANKVIVPGSFELASSGMGDYVISKQIKLMDEPRLLSTDDLEEKGIIFPESANREVVNRFRELRTKLLEKSGGNNFSIVVTSCALGGGASFVALNLAVAFAFDSSKTALIIDCNLREPSLHDRLDLKPEHGLTDFLEDPNMDIASILYPSGIKRLRMIPTGSKREYPGEFFTSFRMKQFLNAVRKRYPDRFVIIDAPSLEDTPDARILSELCDYTLLVVPHAGATDSQILSSASAINREKFVGVVIND